MHARAACSGAAPTRRTSRPRARRCRARRSRSTSGPRALRSDAHDDVAGERREHHRRDQVRAAAVVLLRRLGGDRCPARSPRSPCARRRGRRRARSPSARAPRARCPAARARSPAPGVRPPRRTAADERARGDHRGEHAPVLERQPHLRRPARLISGSSANASAEPRDAAHARQLRDGTAEARLPPGVDLDRPVPRRGPRPPSARARGRAGRCEAPCRRGGPWSARVSAAVATWLGCHREDATRAPRTRMRQASRLTRGGATVRHGPGAARRARPAPARASRSRRACARARSTSSPGRSTCSAPARRCGRRSRRGAPHSMILYGPPGQRQDDACPDRRRADGRGVRGGERRAGRPRRGARGDRARRAPPAAQTAPARSSSSTRSTASTRRSRTRCCRRSRRAS